MKKLLIAGMMLTFSAPANATDCANHFCNPDEYRAYQYTIPNWWTPYGKGTYWDPGAPTMDDAPSWLKLRTRIRRHMAHEH